MRSNFALYKICCLKTLQECGAECYSKNVTFTSVWYWSVRLVGSVASVGWEVTGISFKSALTSKSLLCSAFWPGLFLAGNRQFSRYRQKWQGMQQVGNRRRRRRRRGIPKTRIKMGQGQYQLTNVSIIKKMNAAPKDHQRYSKWCLLTTLSGSNRHLTGIFSIFAN